MFTEQRGRKVPLNAKAKEAVEHQLEAFKKKFGREPGPKEPLFFDPDQDVPMPMSEGKIMKAMVDLLKETTPERPELIYAYKKSGVLISEVNKHLVLKEDLQTWNKAVQEYQELAVKGMAPEI